MTFYNLTRVDYADGTAITDLPLRVDVGPGQADVVAGPHSDLDLFASAFFDARFETASRGNNVTSFMQGAENEFQ